MRKRPVTNLGDPTAGAVSGGPAGRRGSVPPTGASAAGNGSDAGGRDGARKGLQPVVAPAASGGQTPVVVAQPPMEPPAELAGTTSSRARQPGSAWSRFALRNWRVRWRLAALIAVPLLTAAVLGAVTINGDVSNWHSTGRVQRLAQLNSAVTKYIQAVEDERDYSVAFTANSGGFSARLRTARRVTDSAAAQVTALADGITAGSGYQPVAVQALNAVQVGAETLPFIREAVADPLFPSAAIMQVYTVNVIQPATTFTSVVGNEASSTDLRRDVIALGALLQVQDSKSAQRAILLKAVSLPQPSLSPDDDASLQLAQRQEAVDLTNFNASVDLAEQQNYTDAVTAPPVVAAGHEESLALSLLPSASAAHPLTSQNAHSLSTANVNHDMSFTVGKVRQVADELTGNVFTLANTSRNNASTRLLVVSLVTLLLLLLVALVSAIVARSLIRPLRKLRSDALDVAGHRLPEMVRRLSQSEGADESVDIEPIGVTSTDEIGEVARAFDQVHREAVRLAADEAMLRGNLNAMFINLSRRSQSLIERQLSLIDSLEQSEQDSGRLSSLFRLDHLATRMRRNSENLLVLAGHEVTRRWSQPVALVDVLRAAISEIEQYERVVLNVQPGIVVVGQAVNDVVHLVAEIVENATTFSPEDTQVYVSGQPLSSGGVLLDITDNGVGVSDQEMSHANWRLDNPPVVDVAVSRRMGLFVVGRLAARHGVRVRLRHAQAGGLTALIWLPDTVAAPEAAAPLGRLRRFEADDFGPTPSLSAPTQTAASQATAAARIPRFSPTPAPASAQPAAPSFTPVTGAATSAAGSQTSPSPRATTPPQTSQAPSRPQVPPGPGTGPQSVPAAGGGLGDGGLAAARNGWDMGGNWSDRDEPSVPTPALPVRNGHAAAPANGNGAVDGPEPRTPAAPGAPTRLPAFTGLSSQGPQFGNGSQDLYGTDGPRASDAGSVTNGTNGINGTNGPARPSGIDTGTGADDTGADSRVTVPPGAQHQHRLPIFDSLESDWFRQSGQPLTAGARTQGPQAAPGSASVPSATQGSWTSPADEGMRAAQAAAEPAAGAKTQAGLPRRVPRANLVPGSVGGNGDQGSQESVTEAPVRSPDAARNRMASFQRGVREGRAASPPQTEES
ncbi:MAG: nitrate- and nitrite sensing domain-containing protein [Actinomycetota bacterium]|nr:nitrate- and nitrite sensing domain-containing protein [Actinomycetota bacterium]